MNTDKQYPTVNKRSETGYDYTDLVSMVASQKRKEAFARGSSYVDYVTPEEIKDLKNKLKHG